MKKQNKYKDLDGEKRRSNGMKFLKTYMEKIGLTLRTEKKRLYMLIESGSKDNVHTDPQCSIAVLPLHLVWEYYRNGGFPYKTVNWIKYIEGRNKESLCTILLQEYIARVAENVNKKELSCSKCRL
jgi:hypothetical protein